MNLSNKVTASPQAAARQMGSETVILHFASGNYFGLDAVGSRVWGLMEEGRTLGEICDAMLSEYDVSREDIERDMLALAQELADQDLIKIE